MGNSKQTRKHWKLIMFIPTVVLLIVALIFEFIPEIRNLAPLVFAMAILYAAIIFLMFV